MSALILPRLISCDEGGFTGPNLLNPEQPYFSYASHDIPEGEAAKIISDARALHPTQMPELKAKKLLKSEGGRALLTDILDRIEGRYISTLYEKRLALAGKFFEYIYEPVLQKNNALFYKHNLHQFVAMYLYMQMCARSASIGTLAAEFEAFMRSFDAADAPTLLGAMAGSKPDPLIEQVLRFAKGYNALIARETYDLERTSDAGKWVLDLTISAVFSHLVAWGEKHPLIEVVCDNSEPLRALASNYAVMINRPEPAWLNVFGKSRKLSWNMAKPIAFASSASHAGIQLADLIAGVTAAVPKAEDHPELKGLSEQVLRHLHEECILPDLDILDLSGDEAPVNWVVLEELAVRANVGADPLDRMAEFYEIARESVAQFRPQFFAAA